MKRLSSFVLAVLLLIGTFLSVPQLASAVTIIPSTATVVPLVKQDSSDCLNSNVTTVGTNLGGFVTITQLDDKSFTANVLITSGTPNTKYNFYLKCVQQVGSINTNAYGVGYANILLGSSAIAGKSYGFDMYPDGAPLGNKYQSLQFKL
jgi:hypothetical protein